MNILRSLLLLPLLLLLASCSAPEQDQPVPQNRIATTPPRTAGDLHNEGVAVLELFTSEGCSSCPSADRLLGEIAHEAEQSGRAVYPLAFHVDYWNRLGWSDPYSSAAYSQRQGDYSRALHLDGVYTPQLVVNGVQEFVGSKRSEADRAIAEALAAPAATSIVLDAVQRGDSVVVDYNLGGETDGSVVNVAVAERETDTDVPRGENAGRKLHHTNVVRGFTTVGPASGQGRVTLPLPAASKAAGLRIVGYVQRRESMQITGAALCSIR